jgi:pilus assembly protein FimV
MPQASQIDSTEVDPVAEADVYIAYGREEQAEDILKEALRLQPDRHSARVKLMEIVARRGDRPTFLEMARELKERTGASGEDWERAVALGRSIDPSNALFAGAPGVEVTSRGPTTEMRFGPTTRGAAADSGYRAPPATLGGDSVLDFSTTPLTVPAERKVSAKDSVMSVDSKLGVETQLPIDPATNAIAPTTQGHPTESGRPTEVGDLSTLEFEALNTMPATQALDEERAAEPAEPEALNIDLGPSPAAPRMQPMPDLDLSLPPLSAPAPAALPPSRPVLAPEPEPLAAEHQYLGGFDFAPTKDSPVREPMTTSAFNNSVTGRRTVPPPLEDALSRPSLLGDLGALPEEGTTRLASNTDQATVPLIDFDLTGADAPLTGTGRGATPTGSPMASQMATKLDLARGYIDLGVKDGARELLEEVMRDGTREQRQHAVELLKQVER